jgi:hypothetical protein
MTAEVDQQARKDGSRTFPAARQIVHGKSSSDLDGPVAIGALHPRNEMHLGVTKR